MAAKDGEDGDWVLDRGEMGADRVNEEDDWVLDRGGVGMG